MSRILLAAATVGLLCLSTGCGRKKEPVAAPTAAPPTYEGTVVALGDSLTAGYGVPETDAYPAQLERRLQKGGYRWRVINAGISGETSSGALARVDWILGLKPDIVILETGANDGLRGVDPRLTRENIDKTVAALQAKGVVVVLAGMRMLTNLGADYVTRFAEIYPAVARKNRLIRIPFFLSKVAGDPALNQADGIHPFPKGYAVIAETVYPYLVQAIEQKRKSKELRK